MSPPRPVVLVDDDPAALAVARRMLGTLGFAVTTFHEPAELLDALPDAPFLLVSDINMPGMDGWKLVEVVRERSEGAARCLLMTGAPTPDMADRAKQAGIPPVLTKPFTLEELKAAVEAATR